MIDITCSWMHSTLRMVHEFRVIQTLRLATRLKGIRSEAQALHEAMPKFMAIVFLGVLAYLFLNHVYRPLSRSTSEGVLWSRLLLQHRLSRVHLVPNCDFWTIFFCANIRHWEAWQCPSSVGPKSGQLDVWCGQSSLQQQMQLQASSDTNSGKYLCTSRFGHLQIEIVWIIRQL